jgi:hypothetical protein
MGGVVGWWDESSDPEISDALDELAGQGADEHGEEEVAEQVNKVVAGDKVLVAPAGTSPLQLVTGTGGWISMGTLTGATNSTTLTLDYINLPNSTYRRYLEYQEAFVAVDKALQELTPKVMGLPSKEYKGLKKELELVAKVMSDAKKRGLI